MPPKLPAPDARRQSLAQCDLDDAHARRLLAAFRRDMENPRYANGDDLMGYCLLSAHPVGHHLLELQGEYGARGAAPQAASDALCPVLKVFDHLQDITEDCRAPDRIDLPRDWMEAEAVCAADLTRSAATPGRRRVIRRALDGCDGLLRQAGDLPRTLHKGRPAAESAVIVALARRLSARLRRTDHLAGRVHRTGMDLAAAVARGLGVLPVPTLRGGIAAEPAA